MRFAADGLTIVEAHEVVEVMRRTGTDADVVFLGDGVLLGEDALLGLIVELDGATEVSGGHNIYLYLFIS